jgi:hypothetical protein
MWFSPFEKQVTYTPTMSSQTSSPSPSDGESFLANILKPGSSLNPTFLLIVDGAFTFLLLVFIALAFMTGGNMHIFGLMGVELALWVSVKW